MCDICRSLYVACCLNLSSLAFPEVLSKVHQLHRELHKNINSESIKSDWSKFEVENGAAVRVSGCGWDSHDSDASY